MVMFIPLVEILEVRLGRHLLPAATMSYEITFTDQK